MQTVNRQFLSSNRAMEKTRQNPKVRLNSLLLLHVREKKTNLGTYHIIYLQLCEFLHE